MRAPYRRQASPKYENATCMEGFESRAAAGEEEDGKRERERTETAAKNRGNSDRERERETQSTVQRSGQRWPWAKTTHRPSLKERTSDREIDRWISS